MSFPKALSAFAILIAEAIPSLVGASEHETRASLRLVEVVRQAREQNPRIAAARARAEAARHVPVRVSALADPTLSWEAWNAPDSFDVTDADNNIFRLTQRIPYPGKLGLARDQATREADSVGADARAVELEVVAQAERAYADLWRRHQELTVYERDRSLAARFARVTEERYAVGASPQVDVLRSQVEVTRLLTRTETAKLELRAAAARLNAILSQAPDTGLGVPEEPQGMALPDDPKALVAAALERRPDLAALRATVGGAEAALASARLGLKPDFEVSVARFQNAGARDGFGAMAAVTLPFAWRSKYDAGIGEADAMVIAARSRVRSLEDRISRDVAEALFAARSASIRRDLFLTTHLPQSEQAMRSAASGYAAAAVDFTTLIETFRAVEMVHLEHAEASADLGRAAADLERAVGGGFREILLSAGAAAPSDRERKEHP